MRYCSICCKRMAAGKLRQTWMLEAKNISTTIEDKFLCICKECAKYYRKAIKDSEKEDYYEAKKDVDNQIYNKINGVTAWNTLCDKELLCMELVSS